MMKTALLAATLLIPVAAFAASPEETYLAARDAAMAKLATMDSGGTDIAAVDKQAAADVVELTKAITAVIGPVTVKGLTASVKFNADTLTKGDEGYGALDGLLFTASDKKTTMVVTTEGLVKHWLVEHKNWQEGNLANVPQEIEPALNSDLFYSQALETDAAYSLYATLPVTAPAGGIAVAHLVGRSQDVGPTAPDEVVVSVVAGGKVYVIDAPAAAKIGKIPACDKIWKEAQAKADKLQKAYNAANQKDEALFDQSTKAQEDGAAAYDRCFDENAKSKPAFTKLTQQAQALVALLPAM